jgi:hypothetical protein
MGGSYDDAKCYLLSCQAPFLSKGGSTQALAPALDWCLWSDGGLHCLSVECV